MGSYIDGKCGEVLRSRASRCKGAGPVSIFNVFQRAISTKEAAIKILKARPDKSDEEVKGYNDRLEQFRNAAKKKAEGK